MVKEYVRDQLDGLEPVEENRAYLSYMLDKGLEGRLISFLQGLESNKQRLGITDVQLSLTR
jgi:hypothetical protein